MGFPLTDDQIAETLAAIPACRDPFGRVNYAALSAALGTARSTAQHRVRVLSQRGLLSLDPMMPEYVVKETSSLLNKEGDTERTWVKQIPERRPFAMPEGHTVKGVSALLDQDANVIAQWVKTKADDTTDDLLDAIRAAFDGYEGRAEAGPAPDHTEADLATVYCLGDHHLGMYAWARETGEAYDLDIAQSILIDAMGRLVASAPVAETGIVLNLGDFFHADNAQNRTERSGAALDVDTRYAKVLQTGVELMVRCVEMAASKHRQVIVRCLPGNHDPHTSLALSVALAAFFRGNERVFVDTDPGKFFMHVHGRTMIVGTHGDMAKADAMPGLVAAKWPRQSGETDHRYAYLGHAHHRSRGGGETNGMVWETFQVLPPKDAWHAGMGYTAGRSMTAITHHREHGEYMRHTVAVTRLS